MSDYRRGYSRGYCTGSRRADAENARLQDIATRAAKRAERAEQAAGIGHCETCRHWDRGGGGPHASVCAWGICRVPRSAGTPWGTWAAATNEQAHDITTTPRFGCVLYLRSGGRDE